jgi:hypothetical protein
MKKIIVLLGLIVLIGCASPSADLMGEEEMEQALSMTLTAMLPLPTETEDKMAKTMAAGQTQNVSYQATKEARASSTPRPTRTPKPTATPTKEPTPTPIPEPITLTGSGDSVVDFDNPFPIGIAHIIGNAGGRYFGVTSYDAGGEMADLLVNTTDPYDGIVLMDVFDTHTTRFEVEAVGEWTIVVDSFLTARRLEIPGTIEGIGDDVILLIGETPDLAHIIGNADARYFGVMGYGSYADLLVNTTDPYEGTVPLASDTGVIEFEAVGPWSIEVTEK